MAIVITVLDTSAVLRVRWRLYTCDTGALYALLIAAFALYSKTLM